MAVIRVEAEGVVGAPAERVYAILADYRQHHPRILPAAFSDLVVEEGGAGTIIRFKMKVGGQTRASRQYVAEPEPGRVLTESDPKYRLLTTFTVTPEGEGTRVRIDTVWESGGIRGFVERMIAPRMLRPIYADELQRLDRYARPLVTA
jgi:carbon monoxide dehydrogenase subunit G